MNRTIVLCAVVFALAGCGHRGFYAHVPIASAALVHACAVAETDFHFQKAGGSLARKLEMEMAAGGEATSTVEIEISKATPGFESTASSAKTLKFEVATIPSLDACLVWGYLPQLGLNGCLPNGGKSGPCTSANARDLLASLQNEKAIQLKASVDLACPAGPVLVSLMGFSPKQGVYKAEGCGKAARYVVANAAGGPPAIQSQQEADSPMREIRRESEQGTEVSQDSP